MKSLARLCERFFDEKGLFYSDENPVERNGCRYNANRDTDWLCFRKAVGRFLMSGTKEDAFDVYFCYSEIFSLFGKGYENTRVLLEMLSDYEYNAGRLLAKHRDHYSHSVYVFALGLAIYENLPAFRAAFSDFYRLEGKESKERFLYMWGLTALFHDIGYPFEMAHQQISRYTGELGIQDAPYVSFGGLEKFLTLDDDKKARLSEEFVFADNIDKLLVYGVGKRIKTRGKPRYSARKLLSLLRERVVANAKHMDHAYFSAVLLVDRLLSVRDGRVFGEDEMDAVTAILLHNSLYRYELRRLYPDIYAHIRVSEHPLAYLLLLCDELQCWDRAAYGRLSKEKPIAWDVNASVTEDRLRLVYKFDDATTENAVYTRSGKMAQSLKENIVDSGEICELELGAEQEKDGRYVYRTASESNFINLCDFAQAINSSYNEHCERLNIEHLQEAFGDLTLEYKLSNINNAKSYARKLEEIDCFYSDRDLGNDRVAEITAEEAHFLAREEHVRWVKEKLSMGWRYGTDYLNRPNRKSAREQLREHADIVPFEMLATGEKNKDMIMINNIVRLLEVCGHGVKIYRSVAVSAREKTVIGVTGHRMLENAAAVGESVTRILREKSQSARITLVSSFAPGADLIAVECALREGIAVEAVLPMPLEKYVTAIREDMKKHGAEFTADDEQRLRHMLALTRYCEVAEGDKTPYENAAARLVEKCDEIIAVWDGNELPLTDSEGLPQNRGGTYHTVAMAKAAGKWRDELWVKCLRK